MQAPSEPTDGPEPPARDRVPPAPLGAPDAPAAAAAPDADRDSGAWLDAHAADAAEDAEDAEVEEREAEEREAEDADDAGGETVGAPGPAVGSPVGGERVRIRDADRTRARVLDSAERVFARQGYEAARLHEIGRIAGVSRGTPGYFFRSKEELYRAVMTRLLADSREALEQVEEEVRVDGGEPWHLLAKYVDGYVDFLARRPAFVRLVQWECVTGGPFLAQVAAHVEALSDAMRRVLEAGALRFRPVDPVQLMLTVAGAAWLPFSMDDTVLPLLRIDADDPTFLANRKRHLTDVVLYGVSKLVAPGTHSSMSSLAGRSTAIPASHPVPRPAVRPVPNPPAAAPRPPAPHAKPAWRLPGGE